MKFQIAIDGTSGVGKSTIAKQLSKELNFLNINTGLFFRGITYYKIFKQIDDFSSLIQTLQDKKELVFKNNQVFLNYKEIKEELFAKDVSAQVALTAGNVEVRAYILKLEQELACSENVVMEGRDIGSVVLPNATLKIFLSASNKIKAQRRYQQLKNNNQLKNQTLEEIENDLDKRDRLDLTRALMPLKKCDDAIEINTDSLTLEEVVHKIKQLFLEKSV